MKKDFKDLLEKYKNKKITNKNIEMIKKILQKKNNITPQKIKSVFQKIKTQSSLSQKNDK